MPKAKEILKRLKEFLPVARTELNFRNIYELTIAVVLSAQATDKAVNKATVRLFSKYPGFFELGAAPYDDVLSLIRTVGLAPTKAKNIIALGKRISEEKDGKIPPDFQYLISLPGVGRKTANVILSEGFHIPRFAVDTHVLRVSNRLGLVDSTNPAVVEIALCAAFPPEEWRELHLRLVYFGRYYCKAVRPACADCVLSSLCLFSTNFTPKK